ncbi:hypothetical protein ATK86_4985 [Nocardia fluminea]|uniref:Uncharacterized protein n=1 Tax=Nocardia fluminea TaxID=134984 RepID=A0A2N3VG35_9NOCA|nr:hypothetical protein ATK86_4985 [Nocardia fluminea]
MVCLDVMAMGQRRSQAEWTVRVVGGGVWCWRWRPVGRSGSFGLSVVVLERATSRADWARSVRRSGLFGPSVVVWALEGATSRAEWARSACRWWCWGATSRAEWACSACRWWRWRGDQLGRLGPFGTAEWTLRPVGGGVGVGGPVGRSGPVRLVGGGDGGGDRPDGVDSSARRRRCGGGGGGDRAGQAGCSARRRWRWRPAWWKWTFRLIGGGVVGCVGDREG